MSNRNQYKGNVMYYIKDCLRFGIEKAERDLFGFFVAREEKYYVDGIYVTKDYNEAERKALALYDNTILRLNEDIEIMYEKIGKKKTEIDAISNFRSQICSL